MKTLKETEAYSGRNKQNNKLFSSREWGHH